MVFERVYQELRLRLLASISLRNIAPPLWGALQFLLLILGDLLMHFFSTVVESIMGMATVMTKRDMRLMHYETAVKN